MATNLMGQMEPYELDRGEEWTTYIERLEQFFVANKITEAKQKVAVLLTVIGSKSYGLLRNLVSPAKPAEKKFEDIVEVMKNHLNPKPLIIAERFKFHRRNQGENESISQYVAELRKLSEKCDFGDYLEQALRDRLVCGLVSEKIQQRLLSEADLSLKKAFEIAQGMETAQKETHEMRVSASVSQGGEIGQVNVISRRSCTRCGKGGHHPDKCFFKDQECRACRRKGHIARMCQTRSHSKQNTKQQGTPGKKSGEGDTSHQTAKHVEHDSDNQTSDTEEWKLFTIRTVQSNQMGEIMVSLSINDKPVHMELDTGASVSLVSEETWKQQLKEIPLQDTDIKLRTYTGESITVLGQALVRVTYEKQEAQLPLLVVPGNGPSLLGRNWLKLIRLNWPVIKKVSLELDTLLSKYKDLFKEELGTVQNYEVKLHVKSEASPKFCKARAVPYALKEPIERELERLEHLKIIEKVNHSEWAAPVVPVLKPDGSIRLCGDYKITVNPVLEIDKYPLPTPEDLFATLAGGQKFSKLDLSHAYQQVLLGEESRKFVTINTHKGLYHYNRLPFGIASAPAVFQQLMEQILQGLPGVACYLDDVLITGQNDQDHLAHLEAVLKRLHDRGLRLKKSKCAYMQLSVEYLGYQVDAEGLHATAGKVKAIVDAPKPCDVKQLRAFLGLVNYYGRFVPNLATMAHPLNQLLCKDVKWQWNKECDRAFSSLKKQLASKSVLVHYDVTLPVKLACDASAYGLGVVISHIMPDHSERPIAYASRSLSKAERNYSQIEKEALSIIFGVTKFHKFLYGRFFTLVTDHKPLLSILGPKCQIPPLAAARFQRWAILLSAYRYDVEFRSTAKHCNADGLSRLPLETPDVEEVSPAALVNLMQIDALPVTRHQLRQYTERDKVLSKVMSYTLNGWPNHVDPMLKPFSNRQQELTVEAGCVLWGIRVIVPEKLRDSVLTELHTSHPGIVRMKSLARLHVWWPGIDKQIERAVQTCTSCQSIRNRPQPVPLHPWAWPTQVWQRIHVDFAGPFQGHTFLVIVDAHSKWVEVILMSSTTSRSTILELKKVFAAYGIPEHLISDNGPQFVSTEFENFLKMNGVRHTCSAPYHPQTNGEAERFVQTLKQFLRAEKLDNCDVQTKVSRFLLSYRSTPNTTTGRTPSELFLKRHIKTRLDLLKPSISDTVTQTQSKQKFHHDKRSQMRNFEIGQHVLAQNFRGTPKWFPGVIVGKAGNVSYQVKVGNNIWNRHVDQLLRSENNLELPRSTSPVDTSTFPVEDSTVPQEVPDNPNTNQDTSVDTATASVEQRYPQRQRNPPDRFIPNV